MVAQSSSALGSKCQRERSWFAVFWEPWSLKPFCAWNLPVACEPPSSPQTVNLVLLRGSALLAYYSSYMCPSFCSPFWMCPSFCNYSWMCPSFCSPSWMCPSYNFVLECVGALLETLMFSRNPTTKGHLGSGWAGQSSQSHPCRSNQMGHLPSVQSFDV